MSLKSLTDANLDGKTVLYRAPYDIELTAEGQLEDLSRLEATLPTLRYLIQHSCKIVILTYVGRPDGRIVESLRTNPHAVALSKLLGQPVEKVDDCVGVEVRERIMQLSPGGILMLENTRFYPEEEKDDDGFAQQLAQNGEVVVFDAFPQAHRSHASVTGIMRHLPSFAGFYCLDEVTTLRQLLQEPAYPFVLVIGGAKISDKVGAIKNLYQKVSKILIGGAVAHVFLRAQGFDLSSSFMEEKAIAIDAQKGDWVEVAKDLLMTDRGQKIILPKDLLVSNDTTSLIEVVRVAPGMSFSGASVDLGPQTRRVFVEIIKSAGTVFWSGPMGKFENEKAREGSFTIAQAMASSTAETVVAGGDTIAVLDQSGVRSQIKKVSLAGGASLEYLSGHLLPGLAMLQENS